MAKAKIQYPTFGVFAESVPDAARLADAKTPAAERERIVDRVEWAKETAHSMASRDPRNSKGRAAAALRDSVLKGLRCTGKKPMRGEPQRLANLHGIPVTRVRKWIEQSRTQRGGTLPDDWRTVAYGDMVKHQTRTAARKPRAKKRPG